MSSKNWWLEDVFIIEMVPFLGDEFVSFRGIDLPLGTSQGEGSASEGWGLTNDRVP